MFSARKISSHKAPLAIAIAAVLSSLVFSFIVFPRIQEPLSLNIDPDKCGELAANIFYGRGYFYNQSSTPAVDRGPVYPYLIAGVFWLVGGESVAAVQVFQSLCHGLTCLLIVLTARRLFNERIALVAGSLCAVHPMLIWYTSRIWIETVHTLLITAVIFLIVLITERATVSRLILAGLTMGIAILTKSILILFPLALGLFIVLRWKKQGIQAASVLILVSALVVAPWTVRNYRVCRRLIPVHTSLGLNLVQGDAIGEYWTEFPFSTLQLWQKGFQKMNALLEGTRYTPTDPDGDRLLVESSLSYNISHPTLFLKKIVVNSVTFWYLSESPVKSIFLILIQLPVLILVIVASVRLWRKMPAVQPVVLLLCYFFVCHAFIVGWARYSVPIVPACLLFASFVVARDEGVQGIQP
jgi:4-amino-4-deoxy-L-arabinose transferase-like glycosyltransferase